MITVGMNYHVKPGKQLEFEQKFAAVLDALQAADGHEQSNLFRDVHDDAAYLIVSEWSAKDRFVEFIRSEAFKDVRAWGKAEILSARPDHTIYNKQQAASSV